MSEDPCRCDWRVLAFLPEPNKAFSGVKIWWPCWLQSESTHLTLCKAESGVAFRCRLHPGKILPRAGVAGHARTAGVLKAQLSSACEGLGEALQSFDPHGVFRGDVRVCEDL